MLEKLKEAKRITNQSQISDIQSFILKNQKKIDADLLRLVAEQWLARQKAKYKLPTWFANENIIFPPPLSVEQASSELTANYKAAIFTEKFGTNSCTDLTGGMGLDTWALAQKVDSVTYIEQNEHLCDVAKYNFEVLEQKNIEVLNEKASILNHSIIEKLTHFFIDPHRRDDAKNKVFKIEDCEPNLLEIKHLLPNYMVKFSPMLDIKLAIEQLKNISEVHIVAVENEVKELLFVSKTKEIFAFNSKKNLNLSTFSREEFRVRSEIHCVNFLSNKQTQNFSFTYEEEENLSINYSKPSTYIYEPNAAILKAGAFKSIAVRFNLQKLAPNSHLYTSEFLVENFPGRNFLCEAVCKFDKKEINTYLSNKKANISTRNFPMKPEEIKKKLGLQDGGDKYIFATETYEKQKIILICSKAF